MYKGKLHGAYRIVASAQGIFNIDPKGVVYGREMKNMSVPEMENNITDLLSKPVNDTMNRNATEEAMYANDKDIAFNLLSPFSQSAFNASTN